MERLQGGEEEWLWFKVFLFHLRSLAYRSVTYSITERTKDEFNDSHLSAVHVLSFKMSLFPKLLAMTRLIV